MEADKIKDSIKRAAQELFRKFGYHKTSVNEIAKKAKIAKATIYKYFDSKEAVLHALLMDYIKVSVDELIHTNTPDMGEEEQLNNLIMKTCRLSYTICNEFIGWDFIRESTNSQISPILTSDQQQKWQQMQTQHMRPQGAPMGAPGGDQGAPPPTPPQQ